MQRDNVLSLFPGYHEFNYLYLQSGSRICTFCSQIAMDPDWTQTKLTEFKVGSSIKISAGAGAGLAPLLLLSPERSVVVRHNKVPVFAFANHKFSKQHFKMKSSVFTSTDIEALKTNMNDLFFTESDDEDSDKHGEDVKSNSTDLLKTEAENLRKCLNEKNLRLQSLENNLHEMNSTIQRYQDGESCDNIEDVADKVENGDKYLKDKDSLVFHGVVLDRWVCWQTGPVSSVSLIYN